MFNHDDRQMLRAIARTVSGLVARLDTITAELVLLRQSEEAMLAIVEALALEEERLADAEEAEVNQLAYVTLTLSQGG